MKIKEALAFSPRVILICGGESSGKTELLKQLAHTYSECHSCVVVSNHKDIYTTAIYKENITFYYKSRDYQNVILEGLVDADVYLIDESCKNKAKIVKENPDKTFVFVESVSQESIQSFIENEDYNYADCFLLANKEPNGSVSIGNLYLNLKPQASDPSPSKSI